MPHASLEGNLTNPDGSQGGLGSWFGAMDTSLIACVPDADAVVGRWRRRFDPWTAHGIGAHLTVVSLFLPDDRVDARISARLTAIAVRHHVVVSLNVIGQLPGAIARLADRAHQGLDHQETMSG
jgi:hypothetical protein